MLIRKYYLGIMKRKPVPLNSILFPSPVLITECKEEFDKLLEALAQDIAPRGIVEKLFVADIADLVWDKRRLRRVKTAVWDMACRDAVLRILPAATDPHLAATVKDFWLFDAGVRERVLEHLDAYGLDESAIEAEAMRWVAQDLKMLDMMMASLERRFQSKLDVIAKYRQTFADQARIASDRLIEATPVTQLEKPRTKKAG
jgi:hypothetical protein